MHYLQRTFLSLMLLGLIIGAVAVVIQKVRHYIKSTVILSLIPQDTRNPVNPLLIKAFEYIQIPHTPHGIAIDFGAGYEGADTAYLLKKGYQVIAIDQSKEKLQVLGSKKEIYDYSSRLRTIASRFEDLNWVAIPPVDFFIAFLSLSGMQVEDFPKVWKNIVAHIKPGGFFVGDLPPLFKQDLLKIFDGFEMLYVDEVNALSNSDTLPQEGILIYSVIARKK